MKKRGAAMGPLWRHACLAGLLLGCAGPGAAPAQDAGTTPDAAGESDMGATAPPWPRLERSGELATSGDPRGLVIGDVNGDRRADLVVALYGGASGGTEAYLGKGDGTFLPPLPRFPVSSFFAHGPLLADLDRDGRDDLITGRTRQGTLKDAVLYALSGADGAPRTPAQSYDLPDAPVRMAAADLDGDGAPEVLALCGIRDSLYVLPGQRGGLAAPEAVALNGMGHGQQLLTADLDNDARPEAVLLSDQGRALGVLTRQERVVRWISTFEGPLFPAALAAGDLNRDDLPDLVLFEREQVAAPALAVHVYLNESQLGRFSLRAGQRIPVTSAWLMGVWDHDGDGAADLILQQQALGQLTLRRGRGDGTFEEQDHRVPLSWDGFIQGASADLDGDGLRDAVVLDSSGRKLHLLRGVR